MPPTRPRLVAGLGNILAYYVVCPISMFRAKPPLRRATTIRSSYAALPWPFERPRHWHRTCETSHLRRDQPCGARQAPQLLPSHSGSAPALLGEPEAGGYAAACGKNTQRSHPGIMKSLRKRLRGKKGLSLPEILVSCLVGLIGISAILSSFLSGRLSSNAAKHHTQAMNLARARMEYLKSLRYSDLSSMPAVSMEAGLPLDERDGGNAVACTRHTILNSQPDGVTIGVMISWKEKAIGGFKPWYYQLRTWVSSPGQPIITGP